MAAIHPGERGATAVESVHESGALRAGQGEIAAGDVAEFEVTLKINGSGAANHVVRIEVKGPDGVLPHYGAQGLLEEGGWTYLLPTAINDTPGGWTLRVTDLISGKEAVASFEVR